MPCGTSSAVGEYLSQGQGYPFPTYLTRGLALYARDTQLCKAINMWKEVWPSLLGPNVIGHNAAISACEKVQRWEHAINKRQDMWRFQLKPDVIGFDAAISACEKGQQWKQASSVLQEMWTSQRTPDVISYNYAISACEKGQQSEQALSLLLEMWTSHLALVAYVPCRAVRRAPAADCGHWRWSPPRRWGRRNTRRTSD